MYGNRKRGGKGNSDCKINEKVESVQSKSFLWLPGVETLLMVSQSVQEGLFVFCGVPDIGLEAEGRVSLSTAFQGIWWAYSAGSLEQGHP